MDNETDVATNVHGDGASCAIDQSCCGGPAKKAQAEESCTLKPSEMPERVARWQRLFNQTLRQELGETQAVFWFEKDAHVEKELQELVRLEKVCCAHIAWDLKVGGSEVLLRLRADADALGALVLGFTSGRFGGQS